MPNLMQLTLIPITSFMNTVFAILSNTTGPSFGHRHQSLKVQYIESSKYNTSNTFGRKIRPKVTMTKPNVENITSNIDKLYRFQRLIF